MKTKPTRKTFCTAAMPGNKEARRSLRRSGSGRALDALAKPDAAGVKKLCKL